MRLWFITACALAIAAGCTSFEASDVASSSDAGPTSDAESNVDGGTSSDGVADVADARDGRTPLDCTKLKPLGDAATPAFCADFEDGNPLGYAFTEQYGDVALVTDDAYSGTHAMRAAGKLGTGATAGLVIDRKLTDKVVLQYRVRVSPNDAGETAAIVSRITVGTPGASCVVLFRLSETAAILSSSYNAQPAPDVSISGYAGAGRWIEVRIELGVVAGNTIYASVKMDGRDGVVGKVATTTCGKGSLDAYAHLELGAFGVSKPFELRLDDISFDGY